MPNLDLTLKALRLAWLPKLLNPAKQNWKSIPHYFFENWEVSTFCQDATTTQGIQTQNYLFFYRDIMSFFVQIKRQLKLKDEQDIFFFNNKEISIDGKTFFIMEWFAKGMISMKDLLQENGQFLTYEEFQRKYSCKTNFLNFYQVLSAIPKYLLFKARNLDKTLKRFNCRILHIIIPAVEWSHESSIQKKLKPKSSIGF